MPTRKQLVVLLSLGLGACARYNGPAPKPLRIAARPPALASIGSIHVLRNGRVLVADPLEMKLYLYDADLRNRKILADSTKRSGALFREQTGQLRGYSGDSVLFIVGGTSGIVIDGKGRLTRRIELPVDAAARRAIYGERDHVGGVIIEEGIPKKPTDTSTVDSVRLVRIRSDGQGPRDTLGIYRRFRFPPQPRIATNTAGPVTFTRTRMAVLMPADSWALLNDGTVAIVRYSDYHIDWIDPDGRRRSTPPMPTEWRALSFADKQAVIDSGRAQARRSNLSLSVSNALGPLGRSDTTGGALLVTTVATLPDTVPPIAPGGAHGDAEGFLWVAKRPMTLPFNQDSHGDVYDIIDRQGRIVAQRRLPPGVNIRAFGKRIVYVDQWIDDRHRRLFAIRY